MDNHRAILTTVRELKSIEAQKSCIAVYKSIDMMVALFFSLLIIERLNIGGRKKNKWSMESVAPSFFHAIILGVKKKA